METNSIFKRHPQLERYYETSDGTKFYKAVDAHTHARILKNKLVSEVLNDEPKASDVSVAAAVTKPNVPSADDLNPMQKAKLRIAFIEKLEAVVEVKKALVGETAKSVIKAGEARIAALEAVTPPPAKKEDEE